MEALDQWYRRTSQEIADAKANREKQAWEDLGSSARSGKSVDRHQNALATSPLSLVGEATARQWEMEQLGDDVARQFVGAAGDFMRNYILMRSADTVGADKYFHCKANCQAARRGEHGAEFARMGSNARERVDTWHKGPNPEDESADQSANRRGRWGGAQSHQSCSEICAIHRPGALSKRYD